MRPDQRDAAHLWDMLDAAREAVRFAHGLTLAEYSENRMVKLAVERAVQIIGEAANRVNVQFRETHPEISWRKIVAQRNVLVHEYGDVEDALIWDLVQEHLPELIRHLEPLIPPQPTEPSAG